MFDESLASRVRIHLVDIPFAEIKMFGGLAIMVNGNMACGVMGEELMVRTGPVNFADALERPGARPMDFTGRQCAGSLWSPRKSSTTNPSPNGSKSACRTP